MKRELACLLFYCSSLEDFLHEAVNSRNPRAAAAGAHCLSSRRPF